MSKFEKYIEMLSDEEKKKFSEQIEESRNYIKEINAIRNRSLENLRKTVESQNRIAENLRISARKLEEVREYVQTISDNLKEIQYSDVLVNSDPKEC